MHRFGARVRKRKCAVCQRSLPDRDASLHRAMLLRLRQSRLSNELDHLRPRKAFREHFYAPPMAAKEDSFRRAGAGRMCRSKGAISALPSRVLAEVESESG